MARLPTKSTKELLKPFIIDMSKLGPEARRFFSRVGAVCPSGRKRRMTEEDYRKLNQAIDEQDQQFLDRACQHRR